MIGDVVGQESLQPAILVEAEATADFGPVELRESLGHRSSNDLAAQIAADMSVSLKIIGDTYQAPDGVVYSSEESPSMDETKASARADLVVESVERFEALPAGADGSRRAVVRWSDGSVGEALRWYDDEILICEGDLIGRSRAGIGSLKFRRDREWLQA